MDQSAHYRSRLPDVNNGHLARSQPLAVVVPAASNLMDCRVHGLGFGMLPRNPGCTLRDHDLSFTHQNEPGLINGESLPMKRKKAPAPTKSPPRAKSVSTAAINFSKRKADDPLTSQSPAELAQPADKVPLNRSELPAILLEGDDVKAPQPLSAPHKFDTGALAVPVRLPQPPNLPASYGSGKLTLTARDPSCLYAHWDLPSQSSRSDVAFPISPLTLRVHRESASGPLLAEVAIQPGVNSSFIAIEAPEASRFVAELGYSAVDTGWKSIAAAETSAIAFPQAPPGPARFATLPVAGQNPEPRTTPVSQASPIVSSKLSEKAILETGFPLPNRLAKADVSPNYSVETELPVEPPSQARAPKFGPEWVGDAEGFLEEWDTSIEVAPADDFSRRVAASPERSWTIGQSAALAEIIGWSSSSVQSCSSFQVPELLEGHRRPELLESLVEQPGVVDSVELSSAGVALEVGPQPHGFWFNVNAELIVYGATESSATVTIGGRPVVLRPDGTFSCRFALPDGAYPLGLSARSERGEVRHAELRFSRGTSYSEGTGVHPPAASLSVPG